MKKAIFFDLDGTLWDAIKQLTDSYNLTMVNNHKKYRFDESVIKGYMGLTPLETVHLAFSDLKDDDGLDLFKICFEDELKYLANNPGIIYPNERKVLEELASTYPLFIVSNSDCGYIENYLNSLSMHQFFRDHLCAGDTQLPKWKNILLLKEKYGIDEVIYVGDTKKDKDESERAHVSFVHASYGFGVIKDCNFKISCLDELPLIVKKIFGE